MPTVSVAAANTNVIEAPKVALLIPHFGCESYLARVVGSILGQTNAHLEIHVVDDASPDDGWLRALRDAPLDDRVHLHRTARRVGPYRIKNSLIPHLDAPLIAFQDADDWSHPERIAKQVAALRRWRAGIVGSQYVNVHDDGSHQPGRPMPGPVNLLALLGKRFLVLHPTSVVRRSVFDDLGGFDGTTMFGADDEFLHRAVRHVRVVNVAEVLYFWRRRAGSLTRAPETGLGSPARRAYEADAAARRAEQAVASWLPWRARPQQGRPNDVDVELLRVPFP